MKTYISIKEASTIIGVTTTTLRRWCRDKIFQCHHRTKGQHRRYDLKNVLDMVNPETNETQRKTICYARVSSHDQRDDLVRQTNVLESYCRTNNYNNIETINDIGSGLNFNKKGLNKLLKMLINNQVDKLILTHKDRLLRFGSDLLINVAKHFNTETVILNNTVRTFEEQLSGDVLEIITVFSAKLYGARSHKNKKLCEISV
jgi:predicted site-specific integrase-resolvase